MNEVTWGRRKRFAMDIIDRRTIATIGASVYVRIRLPNNGKNIQNTVKHIWKGRCIKGSSVFSSHYSWVT